MFMLPALTVVIPTRARARTSLGPLRSLGEQTAENRFEVVVAVDGAADSELMGLSPAGFPFPLRVVESTVCGAAAARNRGAAEARGHLILFLDDDMQAGPGLVEAHLEAHQSGRDAVVLGNFTLPDADGPEDRLQVEIRKWWDRHFRELASPSHGFTFRDFCTGNVSLRRGLFLEAGGFDERFGRSAAGEDWEFGLRLLERGIPFVFAPAARSTHHSRASLGKMLARAFEEGRGHVLMSQICPGMLWDMPLARLAAFQARPLGAATLRSMWRAWSADRAGAWLDRLRGLRRNPRVPDCAWWLYRAAQAYFYWLGVRSAVPSYDDWRALWANAESARLSGKFPSRCLAGRVHPS